MVDYVAVSRYHLNLLVNTAGELASLMDITRAANVKGYTATDRANFTEALMTFKKKRLDFTAIIDQLRHIVENEPALPPPPPPPQPEQPPQPEHPPQPEQPPPGVQQVPVQQQEEQVQGQEAGDLQGLQMQQGILENLQKLAAAKEESNQKKKLQEELQKGMLETQKGMLGMMKEMSGSLIALAQLRNVTIHQREPITFDLFPYEETEEGNGNNEDSDEDMESKRKRAKLEKDKREGGGSNKP